MSRNFSGRLLDLTARLFDEGEDELPSLPGRDTREEIASLVESAKQEWFTAQSYFEQATEPELVDHAILSVEAAERKYMYWLKQLKNLDEGQR